MRSAPCRTIALAMAAAFVAFMGCKRRVPASFTQSFESNNRLVTIHYPPEFTVQPVGKQALHLTRNLDGGRDEAVAVITVAKPISTDVHEFARIADLTTTQDVRTNHQYTELRRAGTTCAGAPAVEIEGTWVGEGGLRYKRRACAMVRHGHGFLISYSVAEPDAATDERMLRDIVDSAELH